MEKLFEETRANKKLKQMSPKLPRKETQDAVKQDSDAKANRVKVWKDSNRNADRTNGKIDGKCEEEFRNGKKRWQVHLWEMWARIRAKEMLVNQVGDSSDKESSDDE